ncbi:hypothetical protein ACQ23P_11875 [Staphylococcus cohnii]|uniref:hypothetical protein n=1 Tax=Staphylococcus TaxID=1279 RepID=UPI00157D61DD|nr:MULTISPECIES: hypothetical protein [Staphylococcus]MEB6290472.1 hypothetical protein [Staphylococcus xylosus]QKQ01955.1 hypothetical protein HSZ47_00170 [Staphylococcus saprophyticus]
MSRDLFIKCKLEALSKRANENFTIKELLVDIGIELPTVQLIENVECRFRNYVMLSETSQFELIYSGTQHIFIRLTDFYIVD